MPNGVLTTHQAAPSITMSGLRTEFQALKPTICHHDPASRGAACGFEPIREIGMVGTAPSDARLAGPEGSAMLGADGRG